MMGGVGACAALVEVVLGWYSVWRLLFVKIH